jgi:hypothetical protein
VVAVVVAVTSVRDDDGAEEADGRGGTMCRGPALAAARRETAVAVARRDAADSIMVLN